MTTSSYQLDLARGDLEIQIGASIMLLQVAATYLAVGQDDRLDMAMTDARERMRAALASTKRIADLRRVVELDVEAAQDWRARQPKKPVPVGQLSGVGVP